MLGAVVSIWFLVPSLIPRPLYTSLVTFWPGIAIPTPAPTAAIPTSEDAITLLPETPAQSDNELPAYFVSAADAPKREPFAGEPARIVIPQIALDAPVSAISLAQIDDGYYQWTVPNQFEAGWHDNSARLGETGNTVLNGHHNIHGEVFRDLIDLHEGDEIILYDNQRTFVYQVTMKEIFAERDQPIAVRIQNAQWIAPTEDERITLVTCWPYTDNSHRLVIVAKPTAAET